MKQCVLPGHSSSTLPAAQREQNRRAFIVPAPHFFYRAAMHRKTVIITGAGDGIARIAAGRIAAEGHRVILACRTREQAEAAHREIGRHSIAAELNPASRRSIHEFTDRMHRELDEVDALISSDADFNPARKERELTADGFEHTWFTNHLAPVLLAERLMDRIIAAPQGRIITASANGLLARPFQTVDTEDPMFSRRPFSPAAAYYQSKLAQNIYTLWLAQQLAGTMAASNGIYTANVKLDLGRYPGLPEWMKNLYAVKSLFSITPEKAAEIFVQAALDPALKNTSGILLAHPLKPVPFPAYAKDPFITERVMHLTYHQLGIQPAVTFSAASGPEAPTAYR